MNDPIDLQAELGNHTKVITAIDAKVDALYQQLDSLTLNDLSEALLQLMDKTGEPIGANILFDKIFYRFCEENGVQPADFKIEHLVPPSALIVDTFKAWLRNPEAVRTEYEKEFPTPAEGAEDPAIETYRTIDPFEGPQIKSGQSSHKRRALRREAAERRAVATREGGSGDTLSRA